MTAYTYFHFKTYNTLRVRYFTVITSGGTTTTWSTPPLPPPSMHRCPLLTTYIFKSSRARSDPLGACRGHFLLGEESKVILEQFELASLWESMLPRHCLVIYFSEFLPEKKRSQFPAKNKIALINKWA